MLTGYFVNFEDILFISYCSENIKKIKCKILKYKETNQSLAKGLLRALFLNVNNYVSRYRPDVNDVSDL